MAKKNNGPFARHLYIRPEKFEKIASEALTEVGLMPEAPGEIRIERFAEKKWEIYEDYVDLPEDVLGQAAFNHDGLHHMEINRALAEDESIPGQRRLRSTLAHEVGHGLIHADLWTEVFRLRKEGSLLPEKDVSEPSITEFGFSCRGSVIEASASKSAKFEWWEYQANRLMSSLLLPWHLVLIEAQPYKGRLAGSNSADRSIAFDELKYALAEVFNVNPAMANIRIRNWAKDLHAQPEFSF